jgi:hypothetical protein
MLQAILDRTAAVIYVKYRLPLSAHQCAVRAHLRREMPRSPAGGATFHFVLPMSR